MSDNTFIVTSTSTISAEVKDISLSQDKLGLTRKVIRAKIVENHKNKDNTVEFALVHQRRATLTEYWEDLGGKALSELKAGDAAKISLDTVQTRSLLENLQQLYKVGEKGIPVGEVEVQIIRDEDEVIKTDGGRARLIRKLLQTNHE